ncbi:hypothetical protein LZ012_13750 [Dechloromonas sp. XY25]|uniref:Uncharacterized protein n=1 Tax=Dechloromonas hankyongensis TaxID=2908002 RepID=A0ABS9K4G0_9RHOO|nr:hypothetical protein [Dechloromonas hankyongensis]MCG2578054.1 hypothetical protein [Dechloromonas hankyongensis]
MVADNHSLLKSSNDLFFRRLLYDFGLIAWCVGRSRQFNFSELEWDDELSEKDFAIDPGRNESDVLVG